MKKRIAGGLLTLTLLMGTGSAAFVDVKTPDLAQTTAVLKSLKIMEGDSAVIFAPERNLTRAEFAKLLVTAFGVTDVSAYKNYTVFPDVASAHWAAGYINAAIKHPTIKEKRIIHGYADGTFKPDRTISYGEACTMLMLMLGYQVQDIGPMWPGDYIARAQAEGLADGASVMTSSSAVRRADAAVMLLNALDTPGKEGGKLITALTSSAENEGAILLATSETDSDLRKNQARFYIGGDEPVIKATSGILDEALIGVSGTIYYSKSSPNTVIALLPDHEGRREEGTVRRVQRDRIELSDDSVIKPTRAALLYARGEVSKYIETWFNIQPGDEISLHYDKDGVLELISTKTRKASGNTFVYGTQGAAAIPSGFTITKNGVKVAADALKQYDVVTLDTASKSASVSDARVTGYYDSGTPSFKNPEKVKVMGKEHAISEQAASFFSDLKPGDNITLLFDARGAVAAAYPAKDVRTNMVGVLTNAEGNARITLFNGLTVEGELSGEKAKELIGRAVSVRENSEGKLEVSAATLSGKTAGNWDVQSGTLGSKRISPNARVWEQVAQKSVLYETSTAALPFDIVASADIRYTAEDSAGNIVAIVLGDVTGDAWNYGYGYLDHEEVSGGYWEGQEIKYKEYVATLRTKGKEYKYKVINQSGIAGGSPVGMPKGAEEILEKQVLPTLRLTKVDTVKLTAFDGADGVRTNAGYYPISDEVQVYLSAQKKFVTLNQAKADYDSFTLYAERTADKGGKIRLISAT